MTDELKEPIKPANPAKYFHTDAWTEIRIAGKNLLCAYRFVRDDVQIRVTDYTKNPVERTVIPLNTDIHVTHPIFKAISEEKFDVKP